MTMTMGERIREERRRLGLNQTAFGELGGVGKTTQILYEAGERVPDAEYLGRIAEKGVDSTYILLGKRITDIAGEFQNWDILTDVFEAIDEWARQRKKRTPKSTKMKLAKLFYLQFQDRGKVDRSLIDGHLKLLGK